LKTKTGKQHTGRQSIHCSFLDIKKQPLWGMGNLCPKPEVREKTTRTGYQAWTYLHQTIGGELVKAAGDKAESLLLKIGAIS